MSDDEEVSQFPSLCLPGRYRYEVIAHTHCRFQKYDDTALADTMPCSSLRANGRVVIKDRPCRIVEIGKSMTGKHGRTKCHIIGLDIFNGKKYEDIKVLEEDVVVPRVSSKVYSLVSGLHMEERFLVTDLFYSVVSRTIISCAWRMRAALLKTISRFPTVQTAN